jgi:hypothetical protein
MAMSDKGHDYTESSADRGSTQLATAQLHPARPCLPAAFVPLSGPPSAGPAARRPSCSRPGCPGRRDGGPGTRPTIGQVMPAGSFRARICGVSGFLQSFRTSPACSCPPRPSDARPPRPGSRCGRRSPGPRSAEAPGCAWSTPRRPGPAGRRPPATRRWPAAPGPAADPLYPRKRLPHECSSAPARKILRSSSAIVSQAGAPPAVRAGGMH